MWIWLWFIQGLLGGVDNVDTVAFESIWNNIKEKYISEVRICFEERCVHNVAASLNIFPWF